MLGLDCLLEFGVEEDMTPSSRALEVLEQVEGIDYQADRRMGVIVCSHLRRIEDE